MWAVFLTDVDSAFLILTFAFKLKSHSHTNSRALPNQNCLDSSSSCLILLSLLLYYLNIIWCICWVILEGLSDVLYIVLSDQKYLLRKHFDLQSFLSTRHQIPFSSCCTGPQYPAEVCKHGLGISKRTDVWLSSVQFWAHDSQALPSVYLFWLKVNLTWGVGSFSLLDSYHERFDGDKGPIDLCRLVVDILTILKGHSGSINELNVTKKIYFPTPLLKRYTYHLVWFYESIKFN